MRRLLLFVTLAVSVLSTTPAVGAPNGWITHSAGGIDSLRTVDAGTGTTAPVGATGLPAFTTLAVAPTGTLYGVNTSNSNLYRIDPATAVPTLVGPLGFSATGAVLTVTGDGQLWLSRAQNLYRVNASTGVPTLVGPIGLGTGASGLAGACDGRLYAALDTAGGTLAQLNPATGAGTVIGAMGLAGGAATMRIAFDSAETLYGVNSIGNGNVYTVSLTTGAATVGPVTITNANSFALTHACPAPPTTTTTTTPTTTPTTAAAPASAVVKPPDFAG